MKTSLNKRTGHAGFTLIEMIGVLAVIAILASLLIPKVLNAINDSKINNAVLSYNTTKTAVMELYGKYGKFAGAGGVNLTGTVVDYDRSVLLKDGFTDKPFASKIASDDTSSATNSFVQAVFQPTGTPAGDNATYNLDGSAGGNSTTNAQVVVEVVMKGVALADAKAFNDRLDGTSLGVASGDDTIGRVKYKVTGTTAEVHAYVAHR